MKCNELSCCKFFFSEPNLYMQIISKAELSSLKTQLESLVGALIEINDKSSSENEIDASNRNLLETERHLRGALRELEHLSKSL